MSKILDLQKRANNLLSQHQNDIDEKLNSEISKIFKDMRNTVQSEAQSLSSSIDSTKTYIQQKQSAFDRPFVFYFLFVCFFGDGVSLCCPGWIAVA